MKIIVVEDQNKYNFESLGTTVQMLKGTDKLKVRILSGWGYLENVRRHTKGVQKSMKSSECAF